jgi:D-alanyl-D-alanine carboxypeptidase/D-alanyl-D-alanine-endopeptidase (penicillin-binding protein 4)
MIRFLLFCGLSFMLVYSTGLTAQDRAAAMAGRDVLHGASVSAVVVDLVTGEVLDAHRPDDKLCPASVWKIFTCAAALDLLGPDFRFRTPLVYDGLVEGRSLNGDVLVIGAGDPSLGSRHLGTSFDDLLDEWVRAIKALGIDSIKGDVIVNTAHIQGDGIPRTRIWEDMANYYGAFASGLNIHDNTYFVDHRTGSDPGDLAQVLNVYPSVPGLQIRTEVLSSTIQSDQAFIFGAPGSNQRVVRGTLPLGRERFTIKGSLPDPPSFCAYHLLERLKANGIHVSGQYKTERDIYREPAQVTLLAQHLSEPLSELVRHTLVTSDNLFAEALLMQLGARAGNPTLEGALDVLRKHYQGLDDQAPPFFVYDGSGLSRFNALSAGVVAKLLVKARKDATLRESLLDVLPLAGKEGTVKYFAKHTNLDGNLRLKSGSMDKVRAYAGTFLAFTGRELGFAVLINNYDASTVEVRQAIEAWLLEVYGAY